MKKFNLYRMGTRLALLVLMAFGLNGRADAQIIYGCSPFQDSMWAIDTTTLSITARLAPSLTGFTITGITGMAWDPVGHDTYVIMKVSGVTGRVLGIMDVSTGVCTQVGNLGANFSSLTFNSAGQLFGVTGDGGTPAETLFLIDKATGTTTLATGLGNGADGEIICYNPDDDMIYHWSGNGTVVFEKLLSVPPYTVTNIATSSSETFGALYLGNSNFYTSNINSSFKHYHVNGTTGTAFGSLPDDLRGLVMSPTYAFSEDTVCQNVESLDVDYAGYIRDTVLYHWGDGSTDTVPTGGDRSHTYSATGTFTVHVAYLNGRNAIPDTALNHTVVVRNSPGVALSSSAPAICDGQAVTLTGTFGGSSQWYLNGAPITGANVNTYTTSTPGIYNMVKTNLNGCSDSSATSFVLLTGSTPVFALGTDTLLCNGATLCLGDTALAANSFLWSTGDTTATICTSIAGSYSLSAADNGCAAADTIVINALNTPNVSLSVDTSACPSFAIHTGDLSGAIWSWSYGDGNTDPSAFASTSHTYAANGTYTVIASGVNDCGIAADTIDIDVNCIIAISEGIAGRVAAYPNPARDHITLEVDLDADAALSWELLDLQGRRVGAQEAGMPAKNLRQTITLPQAAGTYLLRVRAGEAQTVLQVVKQ